MVGFRILEESNTCFGIQFGILVIIPLSTAGDRNLLYYLGLHSSERKHMERETLHSRIGNPAIVVFIVSPCKRCLFKFLLPKRNQLLCFTPLADKASFILKKIQLDVHTVQARELMLPTHVYSDLKRPVFS